MSSTSLAVRLFAVLCICVAGVGAAVADEGIQVRLGEIQDRRASGSVFVGFDVDLLLSGPALSGAEGVVEVALSRAVASTGDALERRTDTGPFRFKSRDGNWANPEELRFTNPPRLAETFSVAGDIVLFTPVDGAVVRLENIRALAGPEPIVHPALRAAGIELFVLTPEHLEQWKTKKHIGNLLSGRVDKALGNYLEDRLGGMMSGMFGFEADLAFVIPDEDRAEMVLDYRLRDAGDEVIGAKGWSGSPGLLRVDFERFPNDADLELFLAIPEALVRVPFEFRDVYLP